MTSKKKYALISLAVAFILWLYVTSVVNPEWQETYRRVPVTLDGENILAEKNLMVMMESQPVASVSLEGSRKELLNINSNNLSLLADLTRIDGPGEHYLSYTVVPPADISGSITVVQRDPDRVQVTVVESASKMIPVQIEYQDLGEDYIADKGNEVLDHPEISIYGPKEVVDKIHHALITVDCEKRTESFAESFKYSLRSESNEPVDAQWITTKVKEIRVQARIAAVKKVPLKLTVVAGGGATEQNSSIVIDPKEIAVSGNKAALEALTEVNLGTVNLAEITEDTVLELPIVLPENIRNESSLTNATVQISFPDLQKRELTLTDIRLERIPEGMEAELLTKKLTITVRGPKAQINGLKPEDIIVVLDLADVTGTDSLTPA